MFTKSDSFVRWSIKKSIDERTSKFWSMKISMFWLMLYYRLKNIDQNKFIDFKTSMWPFLSIKKFRCLIIFFARFLSHLAFHTRIHFVNPAGMLAEPIKTLRAICDDTNTQDAQCYEISSWLSRVPSFPSTFLAQGLKRKASGSENTRVS